MKSPGPDIYLSLLVGSGVPCIYWGRLSENPPGHEPRQQLLRQTGYWFGRAVGTIAGRGNASRPMYGCGLAGPAIDTASRKIGLVEG